MQFRLAVIRFSLCVLQVAFTLTQWRILRSWKREQGELWLKKSLVSLDWRCIWWLDYLKVFYWNTLTLLDLLKPDLPKLITFLNKKRAAVLFWTAQNEFAGLQNTFPSPADVFMEKPGLLELNSNSWITDVWEKRCTVGNILRIKPIFGISMKNELPL